MSFLQNVKYRWNAMRNSSKVVELSYSRVQAYQRCPWLYHLVYELGWRAGPSSSMALGMTLHRTLASYHSPSNTEHTLDRLWEIYDQEWVNEGFASPQDTLDAYDKGRKMLEMFFTADQKRTSKVTAAEKDFDLLFKKNLRFRGTVDRVDQAPDGTYEIVEYKTHSDHWNETRINNDLQMSFYAVGMQKFLEAKSPVRLKYYFLSSGETVTTTRTEKQSRDVEKLLVDVGNKIRSSDFRPNTNHCNRCEFGKRCSYFKKEIPS